MTTIMTLLCLSIISVCIVILAIIIKSLDAQLTIMVRELNEIWEVLTELRDKDNGKTVEIQSK